MGKKPSRANGGVGAALLERTYATSRLSHKSEQIVRDVQNRFHEYPELQALLDSADECWQVVDILKAARDEYARSLFPSDHVLANKIGNFMIKHRIT